MVNSHIINKIPPYYYQQSIKNNLLQRIWHFNKLQVVSSLIPNKPNKILDVGCASGWFISEISKKFPKTQCYGIDVYAQAIVLAKKLYPQIKFKVADAHKLPFKKDAFEVVVCTEVLEHVENPQKVILEIKRILKRAGTAVIELDSGSLLFSVAWFIWKKFKGRVWQDSHLTSFTVSKLETLITAYGLKVIKKRKFNLGMAVAFLVINST